MISGWKIPERRKTVRCIQPEIERWNVVDHVVELPRGKVRVDVSAAVHKNALRTDSGVCAHGGERRSLVLAVAEPVPHHHSGGLRTERRCAERSRDIAQRVQIVINPPDFFPIGGGSLQQLSGLCFCRIIQHQRAVHHAAAPRKEILPGMQTCNDNPSRFPDSSRFRVERCKLLIFKMIEFCLIKFHCAFRPEFMSGDGKNRLNRNFRLEFRQMSGNAYCCFPCQFEDGTRFRSRNRTGFQNPEPPVRENQPRRLHKQLRDKAFRPGDGSEIKQIPPPDLRGFIRIEQNCNRALQIECGEIPVLLRCFFCELYQCERFRGCFFLQGFRKIPARKRL